MASPRPKTFVALSDFTHGTATYAIGDEVPFNEQLISWGLIGSPKSPADKAEIGDGNGR